MTHISATLYVLGLVTFTAHALVVPEKKSSMDVVFENAAQEVVYLSEILRDVEKALAENEELKTDSSDEYFIRVLWDKTKEALKNATEKVMVSVKGAYDITKDNLTGAAKEAQEKLKAVAAEIMAKMLAKITSQYALEDSTTHKDVMKTLRDLIQAAVDRLLETGKGLEQLGN
ncbi:hypothetical protein MTO96_051247 [Rhipicephalus appendiculatus]